jgi:hexokinase
MQQIDGQGKLSLHLVGFLSSGYYLGSWVGLYLVELLPNRQAGRQQADQVLRSVTTSNLLKSDGVES